jgi:uncharacterized protein with PIN domain
VKIWPAGLARSSIGSAKTLATQLNFGDCFADALSEREQLPLSCAGKDLRLAGFLKVF